MLGSIIKKERMAQNMSQEVLCHGICSPSYLSKIENNQVSCSEEMYRLLFRELAVTYVTDPALVSRFDAFQQQWRQNYWLQDGEEQVATNHAMRGMAKDMLYSSRSVDAHLLYYLLGDSPPTREELSLVQPYLTGMQTVYYALLRAQVADSEGNLSEAVEALELAKTPEYPVLYLRLGIYYFKLGKYEHAKDILEQAYIFFACDAFFTPMMESAAMLSSCFYNTFQPKQAWKWNSTVRRLAKVLNNEAILVTMDYNEGSSQTEYKNYERAEIYLASAVEKGQSLALADREMFFVYQKRAINAVFLGDISLAWSQYEIMKDIATDKVGESSKGLLYYMLTHPGYATCKEYVRHLEDCFKEAEARHHHGVAAYFVYLLYDAYKGTRQYKKALALRENYTFPKKEDLR